MENIGPSRRKITPTITKGSAHKSISNSKKVTLTIRLLADASYTAELSVTIDSLQPNRRAEKL